MCRDMAVNMSGEGIIHCDTTFMRSGNHEKETKASGALRAFRARK